MLGRQLSIRFVNMSNTNSLGAEALLLLGHHSVQCRFRIFDQFLEKGKICPIYVGSLEGHHTFVSCKMPHTVNRFFPAFGHVCSFPHPMYITARIGLLRRWKTSLRSWSDLPIQLFELHHKLVLGIVLQIFQNIVR